MPSITKDAHLRQVSPLPDVARDLAPQSVALASDQVRAALDRHVTARREVEQAEGAAEAARRADRRAAADAAERDKQRMPKAKLEKAEKALEAAQRRQQGAADALRSARAAFVAELREHADTIRAALERDFRQAGADAADAVDRIEAAMIRRSALRIAEGGLTEPVGSFATGSRKRSRRRDPLAGPVRATLDSVRGALGIRPAPERTRSTAGRGEA